MVSRPSSPLHKRRRRGTWHRCEQICCSIVSFFPIALVLSLTTWGVYVEVQIAMLPDARFRHLKAALGVVAYGLLNWSYLAAVYTDPGSPLHSKADLESAQLSSVTVKSTGEMRFCKKCQTRKPDRAHHCSTCRRCVLKMDHHCPWLATCVGFRNYKAFLLFLSYTSIFCWICFAASASWMWTSIIESTPTTEVLLPAQFIILSVISGIIGIVITGFTAYHVYLTLRNRTTIESLEKTKYLSPVKQQVAQQLDEQHAYDHERQHSFGEQLRDLGNTLTEIHANALPGVLRPEEGEEHRPSAHAALSRQLDYNEYQRQRERQQYENYLDDRDSEKLPNAFDLGWRRNLRAVLGPTKWLWFVPICNSIGDGWQWEQNQEWFRQRQILREAREAEMQRSFGPNGTQQATMPNYAHPSAPPRKLPPREELENIYDSDDDDANDQSKLLRKWPGSSSAAAGATAPVPHPGTRVQESWNDVPDEMLGRNGSGR